MLFNSDTVLQVEIKYFHGLGSERGMQETTLGGWSSATGTQQCGVWGLSDASDQKDADAQHSRMQAVGERVLINVSCRAESYHPPRERE